MASSSSKKVVAAALAANVAIAIIKFIAAEVTHSSAMLSEAIHSAVDSSNEILLFLGIYLSRRPPDELHPLGYGLELYFWSLIVAIVVFAAGGGMSIYEGIFHLRSPSPVVNAGWGYAVLGIATVFDGLSFAIAWGEFQSSRRNIGFWRTVHRSKDPTTFAILFEDGAALIGLAIAFLGMMLSHAFGMTMLDGIASIAIGLILCVVAVILARESRSLLLGERADLATIRGVREIVETDSAVTAMAQPVTMQLGPNRILLNLDIGFRHELSAQGVEQAVKRIEGKIRSRYPTIKHIYIEAASIAAHPSSG